MLKRFDDAVVGALIGVLAFALLTSMTLGPSGSMVYWGAAVFVLAGAFLRVWYPRALRAMAGAILAVWLIVALSPLSRAAFETTIRRDAFPSSVDAIVVLAAGITADGNLPPQGADRLLAGLGLARNGVSKTLIITRPEDPGTPGLTAQADQERLVSLLPEGTDIVIVPGVTSTRTEGLRIAELAPAKNWRHLAVVTSPSHTRRACAVFERLGFEVSCVPSESRDVVLGEHADYQDRLQMFRQVVYETSAMALYRYRGWVGQ